MAATTDTAGPTGEKPAPAPLDLIQRFVNTRDVLNGLEELNDADALRAWLVANDLADEHARVGPTELERARELREGLRKLLLANNGDKLDASALETVNGFGRGAQLAVRFSGPDTAELAPVGSGFDAAAARLLAIAFHASCDGTWERLKACRDERCEWAFYDASKNRSGAWCAMRSCGNRAKARAYRARQRGDAG